jgi:hyperosmotically inducible protein
MKLTTILMIATVFVGCSSSSSDRPGSFEERQERIENERASREREANRDQMYSSATPAPVGNDFDRDEDGISDADEAAAERADEASAERQPDNTGLNQRDRDPNALTPIDQSNASSDIEITQAIRKKVIGADDLSFNAKNIKIITVSGKVTLRGPVETPEESATIERSARDVPGVKRVENQLEVK